MPATAALLLLSACADGRNERVGITPHAFEVHGAGGPGEHMALPQMQEELQHALTLIRDIDPVLVADGFALQEDGFDEGGCPELTIHNGQNLWIGDCVTETGLEFHGHTLSLHWYEVPIERDWYRRFLWNSGQANVTASDGSRYIAMGDAWVGDYVDQDGVDHVSTFLHGDFLWEAPAVEGTWLQDLYYVFFDVEAQTWPDGSREVWLNGDLARLPTRVHAVSLQDMFMRQGPGACSIEPEGSMRFRDVEARAWYVLEFDGHDAEGYATASCDGCGDVSTLDGEPLGTLCPDFSPWLEWEAWPW